jgi:hypothetical protein
MTRRSFLPRGSGAEQLGEQLAAEVRKLVDQRAREVIGIMRKEIADVVTSSRKSVEAMALQVVALEAELAAIKSAGPRYRGVWSPDEEYQRDTFVTHAGSMWAAREGSKGQRPGNGPHWTLAVKSGVRREARQ